VRGVGQAQAASVPQLGESLREFYARTAAHWAEAAQARRQSRLLRAVRCQLSVVS
jgi:hypothetical protein